MPVAEMITFSERRVTQSPDDLTCLSFTIELLTRDETGGTWQAEMSVQAALHEAGQEIMEHLLALYATDG